MSGREHENTKITISSFWPKGFGGGRGRPGYVKGFVAW